MSTRREWAEAEAAALNDSWIRVRGDKHDTIAPEDVERAMEMAQSSGQQIQFGINNGFETTVLRARNIRQAEEGGSR